MPECIWFSEMSLTFIIVAIQEHISRRAEKAKEMRNLFNNELLRFFPMELLLAALRVIDKRNLWKLKAENLVILQLYWDILIISIPHIAMCATKGPGTIAGDGLADQRVAWMMASTLKPVEAATIALAASACL